MKKFLLPIMVAALGAVGLASCGNQTPAKTAWTEDELKIMDGKKGRGDGYLMGALPFYNASFTVAFDEDVGCVVLQGGRKATSTDVDNYCNILEENDYVEVDVTEDFEYIAELDEVAQFVKEYKSSQGTLVAQDVVAVGLDEDGNLAVYATVFYCYFGLSSEYWLPNDSDYQGSGTDISFATYAGYALDWMANVYEDEDLTTNMLLPGFADSTGYWSTDEYTYIMPWMFGNIYSEYFMVAFDFYLANATEAERTTYMDDLTTKGYASEYDSKYKRTEYTLTSTAGTYSIAVSDYFAEFVTIRSVDMGGFYVSFQFTPAEEE